MRHNHAALFAVLTVCDVVWAAPPNRTFRGEIMDAQCAKMGSHEVMMRKEGARDTSECVRDCFKMGGKYVLYDEATKATYQLDDQKALDRFAGQTVTVSGTFDPAANTIHVTAIKPIT